MFVRVFPFFLLLPHQVGLITSSLIYVDFSSCDQVQAVGEDKLFESKMAELVKALGSRGRRS